MICIATHLADFYTIQVLLKGVFELEFLPKGVSKQTNFNYNFMQWWSVEIKGDDKVVKEFLASHIQVIETYNLPNSIKWIV